MKPRIGILDKRFAYVEAAHSDIRVRFAAIRTQQQQAAFEARQAEERRRDAERRDTANVIAHFDERRRKGK